MKSFRDFAPKQKRFFVVIFLAVVGAGFVATARGALPVWIQNITSGADLERAFFRSMPLPYGEVLFRRPPSETRPELSTLIQQKPNSGDLYALRALEAERQLDFAAAEKDWQAYADKSANKTVARWDLADFYHRRLRPVDEISTLRLIGLSPSGSNEKFTAARSQASWKSFERALSVIHAQALGKEPTKAAYRDWLTRYPKEDEVYARYLDYLLAEKEFDAAKQLIATHQKEFPGDDIFPVKAEALTEYKKGSIQQGLAVYEKSFQPLWQPELVKGYFDLLSQTQNLRKFLDESRAALNKNPEDMRATARLFYYYQQQGKMDAAEQAITAFRLHKEAANTAWTSQDLYTCGKLLEEIHSYPEAARYYFALYNSKGATDSQERALTRLTDMLLTAPEAPIRLGAGELSIYKDIATMDQGPGYLNGILSLILNSTAPEYAYSEEEQRAVSYFHRSRAAELLALLDKNFPNAKGRAALHAKLLDFYAENAQSDAVLQGGKEFLGAFPKSEERTHVALLMADANARTGKTQDEFAIYDVILQELATQSEKMPLGENYDARGKFNAPQTVGRYEETQLRSDEFEGEDASIEQSAPDLRGSEGNSALQVSRGGKENQQGSRSPEYSRVLERYLARLVELKEVPKALGVLRWEIDHNPDDPGLYERLANFLQQNNLSTEEEEIYRRAFAQFADTSWYSKLARFYLRRRQYSEMEKLTRDAVAQFDGSELQKYFSSAYGGTPEMALRLNQYANARFPHNSYFVHNLLSAYHSTPTYNHAAWLQVLRAHWFEEPVLRSLYFEYLASSGELERELNALKQSTAGESIEAVAKKNPVAALELAEAQVWRSHFEEGTPVFGALAEIYPTEQELGRTASSIYRSLAYFDPGKTAVAANIETNLLARNPGDTEILARIGDIYSDRGLFAQAAPYWERIPKVAPGESGGYLEAATIYWDYYDFENALRILEDGRKKLNNPTLFGYEKGAILETNRDYTHAIREYSSAAMASGTESPAAVRLLELARRAKLRDQINDATQKLAADSNYSKGAINLRVRVLDVENRKQDLIAFLGAAVDRATTIEQAAELETMAQQRSLESVREKALEKQAELANDPVTRLQLRYALVRFYEGKKDLASAQRNIEALYRSNPKILGVVRSTVDFYWRTKHYTQAIAVLRQASSEANPQLSKQFAFEGARKSTEAKDFAGARSLLNALLKDSPYDSSYVAAMADTYAQAGDAQGLKQFYIDKIGLFRNAPFSSDERKTRISALRRGLIPALTQLKDYSGAVDQYIELINNFPEDEALTSEAALYAVRYQREKQLLDFYAKTVQQSPRDYRWAMALARVQSAQEDFSGSIDSYGKALTIRPDRTDLRIARAALEERLRRFDDAAADYERLYQLTYKDPKWMEKLAEMRARQRREVDAVAALKTAWIDPAPERADNYFRTASRLETWGMLEQAKSFAEQGLNVAGGELLANPEHHDGAQTYARILTRLRKYQEATDVLGVALQSASDSLPVLKEQVAKEGIAATTDREWRQHLLATRQQTARSGMRAALTEIGTTAARYFTPEEKMAFSDYAKTFRGKLSDIQAIEFAIPLVHAAGLAELEVRWRFEILMAGSPKANEWYSQVTQFDQLQRQRVKFAELGGQLEQISQRASSYAHTNILNMAATAYRSAGDTDNEIRVLSALGPLNLSEDSLARWCQLLLKKDPQQLVRQASAWTTYGQSAANYVIANGSAELAQQVVTARSRPRPPIWEKSYAALVGLYFAETRPAVNASFMDALGDQTIGERIGKPVDRNKQLAGDIWFYYASRYGDYLDRVKQGSADDFLSAELEHNPTSSEAYLSLGDYYLEQGNSRKAIEEFNYTLELSSGRADIHDRLAVAYYKDKNRAEAISQWKLLFAALLNQANTSRLPETFWVDFGTACEHLRARGLFAELKPQIDQVVRTYLHNNGNYRSNAVLRSAYTAQENPATATAWLLDVSSSAPDPVLVLQDIAEISWIPLANRAPIFQRILEGLAADAGKAEEGIDAESAHGTLRFWKKRWAGYLIEAKQYAQANEVLATLRKESTAAETSSLVPLEIQCTAKLGTLDSALAAYKDNPQSAPDAESLRKAARQLFDSGDKKSARKILEYVFAQALEEHQLLAANFLGLAEIRLADGDTDGAMSLLKRLVLVLDDPYQNEDSAAALLEKTSHFAEAVVFLEPLSKATPWDSLVRLRLAKARLASAQNKEALAPEFTKIAIEKENAYSVRAQAAKVLAGLPHSGGLGSAELQLLATGSKNITASASDQPFFYEARLSATENTASARDKMQVLLKLLAEQPARGEARLPFFRAAVSIPEDELALASIQDIIDGQLARQTAPEANGDEEILTVDTLGEDDSDEEEPEPLVYSPAVQAQTAREVGRAYLRLNRLSEAISYLQLASKLERSPAEKKRITVQLQQARTQLRRQSANADRQPILHAELEQDRVVRPRAVAAAQKPSTGAGEKP